MKTLPYIEEVTQGNGLIYYHAVDPVSMVDCGHKHRYMSSAEPCLKEMLRNENPEQIAAADGGNVSTEQMLEAERAIDLQEELIEGRRSVYGQPRDTFPRIAQVWSGIVGHEITPEMVPLMMIGHKLVRAVIAPDYSDNSDDVDGYLAIFRELVGPDMINARSVEEYLLQKLGRTG